MVLPKLLRISLFRHQSAFTFLECLVALIIMAVLVAILSTSVLKVRTRMAMGKSMANLRLMAGGLSACIADRNGRLPESMEDATTPLGWTKFWFNGLAYYIEGEQYFPNGPKLSQRPAWQKCPGRPFADHEMALYYGYGFTVTYGWNYRFFGYNKTPDIPWFNHGFGTRITQVEIPSRTIIIGTTREKRLGKLIAPDDMNNIMLSWEAPDSTRFDGAGLYLFLDGHIERLTPQEALADDSYLFKRTKTTQGF